MGQYNPHAPLMVGNEYAPVLYSPYNPDLFVERGYSFKGDPSAIFNQASWFVDTLPAWSVPGHAYLITLYRRGQEANTGPMKTVTVPLIWDSNTNGVSGGGAPNATSSIMNPTDGWYFRLRSVSTGESWIRLRSDTIPTFLSEPLVTQGKRIVDVSILYTASAEPGNEEPVPLEINHYYDQSAERVSYGTAQVDLRESLATGIRRSRWGEICTWSNSPATGSPFTDYNERYPWNYRLLTPFETGTDFLVEFRTVAAAQDGPREIFLHYAAMQITYCEENRSAVWGMVAGADYTPGAGGVPGYKMGRNTQNVTSSSFIGKGFIIPNSLSVGGGFTAANIGATDATITIKRADYGPYNNQGDLPRLRGLRTIDLFPGHPGVAITNTLTPGQHNTLETSDLLPQIIAHSEAGAGQDRNEAPALAFMHVYGVQVPLSVSRSSTVVQEIIPAADAPGTAYPRVRFWARNQNAIAALRLVVETADQGPVTVVSLSVDEFESFPEVADGWRRIDLEADPALMVDDFSVASGSRPAVTDTVHESSGGTTAAWNVTAPAGDLEGQVLLLLHAADIGDIADMGTPTGGAPWLLLHDADGLNSAGDGAARLWWKVGGAAEPASYGLTQSASADGAAIVTAVTGADPGTLASGELSATTSLNNNDVPTPSVPIAAPGGLDMRFAATPFNAGTYTPPSGWTLIAGSVSTPFVSLGAAALQTTVTQSDENMDLSSPTTLGYLGVTVTLAGAAVGPAAPRWESDTSDIRPWEVLAARVIDPTVEGAFDPALPRQTGIGTYGDDNAEGGVEGDLPATADIDVSVVWGQELPAMALTVTLDLQPLAVVDPECPVPNRFAIDGLYYLSVSWPPVDAGYGFVGLGHYELQRQDDTMGAGVWETVATPIHPLVDSFDDFEARIGVPVRYRARYVHVNGMSGEWSSSVGGEIPAPGVTGERPSRTTLTFTSNSDPSRNLAYTPSWEGSAVNEAFTFLESEQREFQRMYGRDMQVAFRPSERGGVQFTRMMLVNTVSIPVRTLEAGFEDLRDLAWADLPYVCVRDTAADRWLANVNVPSGSVRASRSLYVAEVVVTEVSETPFAPSPSFCEGMTARGTLPSTVYEHRFATTPAGDHLASDDLGLRILMRLDQDGQAFPLIARFDQYTFVGWQLRRRPEDTFNFLISRSGGGGFASFDSAQTPFGPGDLFWLWFDYDADGGGATSTGQFFTATDPVVTDDTVWTPLATTTISDTSIPAANPDTVGLPLTVGAGFDGTADLSPADLVGGSGGWNGVIREAVVLGDAGALLAHPDFDAQAAAATAFTDAVGNDWSVPGGICTVDRRA